MSSLSRQRRRRQQRRSAGPLLLFATLVGAFVAVGALSAGTWVLTVAAEAPSTATTKAANQGANSVVYAADGQRLGFIQADVLRTPIGFESMPKAMRDATVAIEDERFWQHDGVDVEGVVRAAVTNVETGESREGGSTLTMQLARTLYLNNEKSIERKIQEAKLAEELEDRWSKQLILRKYLNAAPYGTQGGQTAVGVEAAARTFFDKPARRLELHEAALLAGLPQAPSQYNPFSAPETATRRRNDVLRKMAELRFITPQQAVEAMARDLGVESSKYYTARRESFFFDYVKQSLVDRYGLERVRQGGLKVYTTIDLEMQQAAREAIAAQLGAPGLPSSAIVTIDPDNGQILAMASSARYADSKFNLAAQGKRQPGSTFKIMGLMAALRKGVSAESTSYTSKRLLFTDPEYGLIDVNCYGGSCANSSYNLVTATLKSDNSVYQQLALDIGPDVVKEAARDMGITSRLDGYPGEILGGLGECCSPLEMANAYATIASGGLRSKPTAITRVEFPGGRVDKLGKPKRKRVFSEAVTGKVASILQQNITGGTGVRASIGCPAAGKTGTTDANGDAWFVGFTPNLATSVWVGYPKARTPMTYQFYGGPVDGGTFPAEIWGNYMAEVRQGCDSFPLAPALGGTSLNGYGTTTPGATGTTPGYVPPSTGTTDPGYDPNAYESPPQAAPAAPVEPAPVEPAPAPAETDSGGISPEG